ncbi:MAG: HAD family phosphatase [Eubacterium sp.]|nr:HAD family phosphatase [Eubacterium sp.]
MLKGITTVIFDLDGTLADSMHVWTDIDIQFFETRNIPFPDDLQKSIEGMSFTETAAYFIKRFNLPDTLEELKATWAMQAIDEYRCRVKLKTGVIEFLDYLREHKIKIGIATSNSRELLNAFLEANQLETYIDVAVTSCDVCAGKPAPDVYLKAAELLGAAPAECLVFEDIPMGILAGKNAKMRVCAVEDTYSLGMTDEKRELADYYIRDYFEVIT